MILSNLSSRYHWSACNPSADLPAPSVGRASDSNFRRCPSGLSSTQSAYPDWANQPVPSVVLSAVPAGLHIHQQDAVSRIPMVEAHDQVSLTAVFQ